MNIFKRNMFLKTLVIFAGTPLLSCSPKHDIENPNIFVEIPVQELPFKRTVDIVFPRKRPYQVFAQLIYKKPGQNTYIQDPNSIISGSIVLADRNRNENLNIIIPQDYISRSVPPYFHSIPLAITARNKYKMAAKLNVSVDLSESLKNENFTNIVCLPSPCMPTGTEELHLRIKFKPKPDWHY